MPLAQVRQRLIDTFLRWGKCGAMRVDNGEPLGCPKPGLTSALALWLIAVEVKMIFNKPRCPQQNAKVERMQDTSARWAEIGKAPNAGQLQERLDLEAVFQRTQFCVSRLGNQTRLQAFPELETSRRVFNPDCFDEKRVYRFLCEKVYARPVSKNGQIHQFGQRVCVGRQYHNQTVEVRFDPDRCQWNVYAQSKCVKSFEATHLQKDRIRNLTVYVNEPNSMS